MNIINIKNYVLHSAAATAFVFLLGLATVSAQQNFVANLSGAQTVPAVTTNGRAVCKGVLNAAQTQLSLNCTYSGLASAASAANVRSGAVGVNGASVFDLGAVSGTSGTVSSTINLTTAQVADLRANRFYVNLQTTGSANGEIRGQLHVANNTFNDVDGDGRTDLTVFRPSTGTWYSKSSLNGGLRVQQFGATGDITVSNLDFDGDGISDYAFARINQMNGQVTFNILQSQTGAARTVQLGNVALGDNLATGDYDGDGRMDLGIFRNGLWTYIESTTGTTRTFNWGQAGDLPLPGGDFDRDGKTDFAVLRPTNGAYVWYIRLSSTTQLRAFTYGLSTDAYVAPFDFDGDGASDVAVIREANNVRTIYTMRSSDGQMTATVWGFPSDLFQLGDFDGDGRNDLGAVRNQSGSLVWYTAQSTNGFRAEQFGAAGDQ